MAAVTGTAIGGREARILTWNINGLRKVAASHGGVKQLLDQFGADIVCFQEIKITRAGLVEHDLARAHGYHGFFNHCKLPRKVSYSGVATFVRSESGLRTLASTTSLGDAGFFGSPGAFAGSLGLSPDRLATLDSEGRVLVTDHGHFVLFNVYAPCISSGDENEKTEERRSFKRDFLAMLEARIRELNGRGRGVVLVGDLNACASQLDHGFTMTDAEFYASQSSKWVRGMLGLDSPDPPRLVDCFRRLHPDRKSAFTCWNTQTGARENNYGTRIDYIIAGAALAERALRGCDIMPEFLGSDHCPVRAEFVVPFHEGLTAAASAAGVGGGLGVGGGGGGDDGGVKGGIDESKWPEHPPECSCFYHELTAKQEKLAKYFVAGGQQQQQQQQQQLQRPAPNGDAQQKGAASEGTGARSGREGGPSGREGGPGLVGASGGGEGGGPLVGSLAGAAAATTGGSKGAALNWMAGGKRAGGVRRTLSSGSTRRATARRPGSGTSRQSKLTFGAFAPAAVGGGSGGGGGGGGGEAGRAPSRPDDERGGDSSASEGGPARSHGGGVAPTGGAALERNLSTTSSESNTRNSSSSSSCGSSAACSAAGAAAASAGRSNSGGGGGGGGSAEAWKVLFGQKKSAPPCEHGEPSIQRTVLKPGPNFNRRFYTCARSAGNWPTDRNARCNFFQWRRDGVRGYKDRPPRDESSASSKKRRL